MWSAMPLLTVIILCMRQHFWNVFNCLIIFLLLEASLAWNVTNSWNIEIGLWPFFDVLYPPFLSTFSLNILLVCHLFVFFANAIFGSVVFRVHSMLDDYHGNMVECVSFKTLCCEPEAPSPPKLQSRTASSITVKWNVRKEKTVSVLSDVCVNSFWRSISSVVLFVFEEMPELH